MTKNKPASSKHGPTQRSESGIEHLTIRLVHSRVPGRARFKINKLYRSQRLKRQLESGLRGIPGIRSVQASALRMAETGVGGAVQTTEATYQRLREHYLFRPRGHYFIQGLGETSTFLLTGRL